VCSQPHTAVPECFAMENWNEGWVGGTMVEVFTRAALDVVVMTPANFSAASRAAYAGSSSFTRCAWEVQLGNVDICVGDFWETAERRAITPFTSSIDNDLIRVIVKKGESASFFSLEGGLVKWTEPLSNGVWGWTFGLLFVGALCMWIVDSDGNDMYLPGERLGTFTHPQLSGLAKSFWVAIMSITARDVHVAKRWEGRIVLMGLTLIAWVTAVTYTANLASILIQGLAKSGQYNSLQDIAAVQGTICTLQALENHIQNSFSPELLRSLRLRGFGDFGPLLEALYRGECQAGMIGKIEFRDYIEAASPSFSYCIEEGDSKNGDSACENKEGKTRTVDLKHCKAKACRGQTGLSGVSESCRRACPDYHKYCELIELPRSDGFRQPNVVFALPVAPHVQNVLSSWLADLRSSGRVAKHFEDWAIPEKELVCPASSTNKFSQRVQPESMYGMYFIASMFMAFGLVMRVVMDLMPDSLHERLVHSKWRQNSLAVFPLDDTVEGDVEGDVGGKGAPVSPVRESSASSVRPSIWRRSGSVMTDGHLRRPSDINVLRYASPGALTLAANGTASSPPGSAIALRGRPVDTPQPRARGASAEFDDRPEAQTVLPDLGKANVAQYDHRGSGAANNFTNTVTNSFTRQSDALPAWHHQSAPAQIAANASTGVDLHLASLSRHGAVAATCSQDSVSSFLGHHAPQEGLPHKGDAALPATGNITCKPAAPEGGVGERRYEPPKLKPLPMPTQGNNNAGGQAGGLQDLASLRAHSTPFSSAQTPFPQSEAPPSSPQRHSEAPAHSQFLQPYMAHNMLETPPPPQQQQLGMQQGVQGAGGEWPWAGGTQLRPYAQPTPPTAQGLAENYYYEVRPWPHLQPPHSHLQ